MQNKSPLVVVSALCLLSSCGWVDSTGREGNSAPVTQIVLNDQESAEASLINEEGQLVVRASSTDADGIVSSYKWTETPVLQGDLSECESVEGFDMSRAVSTLVEACADGVDCAVSIEQQSGSAMGDVEFLVTAPKLRAPIGVSYDLVATDNDGGVGRERSTFCLMSINDAPEAVDDSFTILEGTVLNVSVDELNLLSNDRDDDDTSNRELRILTGPKRLPSASRVFSLRDDGGFYYEPDSRRIPASGIDTFEYFLSDGVHDTSSATVSITIVSRDEPPTQTEEIPLLVLIAGIPFSIDLNEYFDDEENATLSYAVAGGLLPPSGNISLSSDGILSGTAASFDEDSYEFDVIASDGSANVTGSVEMNIINNEPVEASSIAAQTAEEDELFSLNVSSYFSDPEMQPLRYAVIYDDDDIELTMNASTGALTGFFSDDGRFTVDVTGSDGFNVPVRVRFVVTVTNDNTSPVFRGLIADQTVELGERITPIAGNFSDADDDDLDITLIGLLPRGVTLGSNGVISGRPTEDGQFNNLRLVATDPFGKFIRSNAFAINVQDTETTVVPPNNEPVYVEDSVFNQGIVRGSPIRMVIPVFTDPDGDSLSYSITGNVLPAGVALDVDTGIVSGTPVAAGWTRDLRIVATDPSGETAVSETFWIRVFSP